MKTNDKVYQLTVAAVLCAIGIIIPLFSPVRLVMEPASFTLASHVAIFIAMFISPGTAVVVALGTTLGFLLTSPIVIALRAASHLVFALIGALVLKKRPQILDSTRSALLFGLLIAVIHVVCEMLVVIPFYFGQSLATAYYAKGFLVSVVLLVGVGGFIHSMIDFAIALVIWKPLRKIKRLSSAKMI